MNQEEATSFAPPLVIYLHQCWQSCFECSEPTLFKPLSISFPLVHSLLCSYRKIWLLISWLIEVALYDRSIEDIRCIVFVERIVTAVALQTLLSLLLPKHTCWKAKYIAGSNSGLQTQRKKKQNEIVEEFRCGKVCFSVSLLPLIVMFNCGVKVFEITFI